MSKKLRPANAGAITRVLKARGFQKSEQHRSGMVRGWSEYTEGIRCQQDMDYASEWLTVGKYADGSPRRKRLSKNTITGLVFVEYQLSTATRASENPTKRQHRLDQLQKASAELQELGYEVDQDFGNVTWPRLIVWRSDENGEVVKD